VSSIVRLCCSHGCGRRDHSNARGCGLRGHAERPLVLAAAYFAALGYLFWWIVTTDPEA
jgi:hypothetical protein